MGRNIMNKSTGARYPRTGSDNERLHARASIVTLLLAKARINHINDAIYGQRCFCNVGGHNNLKERERERETNKRCIIELMGRSDSVACPRS